MQCPSYVFKTILKGVDGLFKWSGEHWNQHEKPIKKYELRDINQSTINNFIKKEWGFSGIWFNGGGWKSFSWVLC